MNDQAHLDLSSMLVVDDEISVRAFLKRWLEDLGYVVRQAANASEALDVMRDEPASIVLCDIQMPGYNGLWLAEQLQKQWPWTAIVMTTGDQTLQTVAASARLGVVDYVTKPFGRELLLQALRRAADKLTAHTLVAPSAS